MRGFVPAIAVLAVAAGIAQPADDARLQSLQTELVLDTPGRVAACDALVFTPDGRHLLATGDDKLVRTWAWDNRRLIREEPLRWSIYREQRGSIYTLALSPDGKRVAIGGMGVRDGAAAVFDRGSREVVHGITQKTIQDRPQKTIWSITFSADGRSIAYGSADGSVWVWEPDRAGSKRGLRRLGSHAPSEGPTNRVKFIMYSDENTLVSVAEDGWVLQWDARQDDAQPKSLFQFEVVNNLVAVAYDKVHHRLAAAGQRKNARSVELRGLGDKSSKILDLAGAQTFPFCLTFDPAGNRLAVGSYSTAVNAPFYKITHGGIVLFDLNTGTAIPGPKTSWYPEALAFHPTENVLAVAGGNDHEITLFDLANGELPAIAEVRGPGSCLWGIGLSNSAIEDVDGKRKAFQLGVQIQRASDPGHPNRRGEGPWQVFDLGERRWASDHESRAFRPEPQVDSVDGWRVAPDRLDGLIWYVIAPDGKQHKLPLTARDYMPRTYTFLKPAAGKPLRLAIGHYWGLSIFALDERTGPTLVRKCVGHQGEVMAIAPAPDQSFLVTASRDQTVCAWSLADWAGQPEIGASFRAEGERVRVVSVDPGSPAWEAKLQSGDTFGMLAYAGKAVPGGPAAWLEVLRTLQPDKECYFVNVQRDSKPVGDRLTTSKQRPIWRFFPMAQREWVLWRHQDYYYDTSTNGDFAIGWQVSRDVDETPTFYKTEQFRVRFHQADKVAAAIAGNSRMSDDESIPRIEPPRVKLVVEKKPGVDAGLTVSIVAEARGNAEPQKLDRLELWVNDHVVHAESFVLPTSKISPPKFDIPPSSVRAGPNRITAQVYNKLELRDQAAQTIEYDRPRKAPVLHGLLIGVSDYSKTIPPQPRLSGAEDVAGVETMWRGQEGKQYRKTSLQVLRDADVTREKVFRAFEALRADVQPDDYLLLYLAGHGLASDQLLTDQKLVQKLRDDGLPDYRSQGLKTGMFFFLPYNFDIRRPVATGVSYDTLYGEVRKLPCRKVVLLDACRSGTLKNSDPIRKLAPAGVGPVILSACEPHQSAIEAPDAQSEIWVEGRAKGLFAIALLQGMTARYRFQADLNRDGTVDAAELVEYTRAAVPKLLDKILLGRFDPGMEQNPSAFLPDLERLLPIARR